MISLQEREYTFVKGMFFNALYALDISLDQCQKLDYIDLIRCYFDTNRRYHNITHIYDMLQNYLYYYDNYNYVSYDSIFHSPALELSIIFHDIVYDVNSKDNELNSYKCLAKIIENYPHHRNIAAIDYNELKCQIYNNILATKNHKCEESDSYDTKLIVCLDLMPLALDRDSYKRNMSAIRQEYEWYTPEDFRAGRLQCINQFLERQRIFPLQRFYELYEQKARDNLLFERKTYERQELDYYANKW